MPELTTCFSMDLYIISVGKTMFKSIRALVYIILFTALLDVSLFKHKQMYSAKLVPIINRTKVGIPIRQAKCARLMQALQFRVCLYNSLCAMYLYTLAQLKILTCDNSGSLGKEFILELLCTVPALLCVLLFA